MVKRRAVMSADDRVAKQRRRHDPDTEHVDATAWILQSAMFGADEHKEPTQVDELDKVQAAVTTISDFMRDTIQSTFPRLRPSAFNSILAQCTSLVQERLTNEAPNIVDARPANIFTLPRIVRNRIYELVPADEKDPFDVQALVMPPWDSHQKSSRWGSDSLHAVPALLQVSHQVRREAAKFFSKIIFQALPPHSRIHTPHDNLILRKDPCFSPRRLARPSISNSTFHTSRSLCSIAPSPRL